MRLVLPSGLKIICIQNCESHEIVHVCFTCQWFVLLSCAYGYTQTVSKIETCSQDLLITHFLQLSLILQ